MIVTAVAERVRTVLSHPDLAPDFRGQVECVLARKLDLYQRAPLWCVPELPRRSALAFGLNSSLSLDLAAAAILYHCAADIVDDAQDEELGAIPGWGDAGWREAVNVGLYLLSAQTQWLAGLDAPVEAREAWMAIFSQAGMTLIAGQHRDLQARLADGWDEARVLSLGGQKAGGALGALMCLAPAAARRGDLTSWWQLGVLLGQMFQVASDLEAYMGYGPHADLAQLKVTLPLVVAQDFAPVVQLIAEAGPPVSVTEQERLRAMVRASGALQYTRWRIAALHREALIVAAELGSPQYVTEIQPILDTALVDVDPVPV